MRTCLGPLAWSVLLLASGVSAQTPEAPAQRADQALPRELEGIGIEERPGSPLPQDVLLRRQDGKTVRVGDYLGDGKPLVLVLAYYTCPMLCTLVINGLKDGLKDLAWSPGKEFRVLTVSIDPRDDPEVAAAKRANYLEAFGRPVPEGGWDFLVGDERSVRRLADAVGFHYRWDPVGKQFAHGAGAFVVTADGRLSRTLYGVVFPQRDLRLALTEASEGLLGTALDKVVLFCFHYDPAAQGYVLAAARVMRLGGVVTVLVLGFLLFRLWRRERGQAKVRAEHAR